MRLLWTSTAKKPRVSPRWMRIEQALLAVLLVCKTWFFFRKFGQGIGYDVGAFLDTLNRMDWTGMNLGVRELFYSYHPPLGFLLAKIPMLAGFSDVQAVQIVSAAASFSAFLLLRAALKRLGLLARPTGVVFLYVAAALPLQLLLQETVNLDVLTFAWASLALYLSIRLLWLPVNGKSRIALSAGLAATLVAAMMTKFSGLFIFSIPVLAALFAPGDLRVRARGAVPAVIACIVAMACVAPYYGLRYVATEGKVFPVNVEWIAFGELEEKGITRDRNPLLYAQMVLTPSPIHVTEGAVLRDYSVPRLWDAWFDFWIRERVFLGRMTPLQHAVSLAALLLGSLATVVGLTAFLLAPSGDIVWRRLGWTLLGIAGVFVSALFWHIYTHPAFGPAKGIYAGPALWAVAFLLTEALCAYPRSPFRTADASPLRTWTLGGFLAVLIIGSYGLPMY